MFLAITDYLLPIGIGLIFGLLIATRKNVDLTQLIKLDAEEFRQNMRKGQLIDIQAEAAFKQKHINGARSFPKRSVLGQLHKLRNDQSIYLVGKFGGSSERGVAKKLLKKGYRPIYILKGGMENWQFPYKEE